MFRGCHFWPDSPGIPRVILASCPRPARDPKKTVGTICALGFTPEKARSPGPPETPGNAFSSRGRRRRGRPKPKIFPPRNPPARLTSLGGAWNVYFPTMIFCRWRTDQNALLGGPLGFLPAPPPWRRGFTGGFGVRSWISGFAPSRVCWRTAVGVEDSGGSPFFPAGTCPKIISSFTFFALRGKRIRVRQFCARFSVKQCLANARQLAGLTRDSPSNPGFLPKPGPGPPGKKVGTIRALGFDPRKNPVAGPAGNARECIFQ